MIFEAMSIEVMQEPLRWAESVRPAFEDIVQMTIHQQTSFADSEIRAALDFSRAFSRLFIMLCVAASLVGICYGSFLLLSSGGEPRKLEQSRTVFKNVAIGLVLSISSYLILSLAITITIQTIGLPETVRFWDDAVFQDDFGIYELLDGSEYALQGEVIMLDGPEPVVCSDSLPDVASDAGWNWHDNLTDTELGGCKRS